MFACPVYIDDMIIGVRLRLRKLALDVPLATNWLLPRPPLPMLAIGLLGSLTSAMQVHIVLDAARCPHLRRGVEPTRGFRLPVFRLPRWVRSLRSAWQPRRALASAFEVSQRVAVFA